MLDAGAIYKKNADPDGLMDCWCARLKMIAIPNRLSHGRSALLSRLKSEPESSAFRRFRITPPFQPRHRVRRFDWADASPHGKDGRHMGLDVPVPPFAVRSAIH
jgi:hypothetical protein